MDYPIEAPELVGRSVSVRVTGMFADPQVLVDGAAVKAEDGQYLVLSMAADVPPVSIRLKAPLLDFVPITYVGDRRVELAPPLAWWQYLWVALPMILLIVLLRGVVPALVGLALSYCSVYLVRQKPERRYLWTALINVAVVVAIAGLIAVRVAARHATGR